LEWEKSAKKQIEIPITEKRGRKIRRYLFSGTMVSNYDSQGRVVIPQPLVDYADLEDPTVIIGAGDHFEIWNKNKWEKYLEKISSEEF